MQDARIYGQPGGRPGAQPPGAARRGAAPRRSGRARRRRLPRRHGRPPARVRAARAGRRAGVRGPRGARPAGGRAAAAEAADHHRRRDGGARRDDRAGRGQGAGALYRRVDRGGAPPRGGGVHHRQADAALRVPRAAGHRQDHGRPGDRQDLLRLRAARHARGGRSAAVRPGGGVPGRDRDQDQRADRLGAGPGAVHRRGVQPGERGRRAERQVRHRGGADAAQAGRGRPGEPDHHPGRLREADRVVPRVEPGPGVPVRDQDPVPDLHAHGDAGARQVPAARQERGPWRTMRARCCGGCSRT